MHFDSFTEKKWILLDCLVPIHNSHQTNTYIKFVENTKWNMIEKLINQNNLNTNYLTKMENSQK